MYLEITKEIQVQTGQHVEIHKLVQESVMIKATKAGTDSWTTSAGTDADDCWWEITKFLTKMHMIMQQLEAAHSTGE